MAIELDNTFTVPVPPEQAEGTAKFTDKDQANQTIIIEASGKVTASQPAAPVVNQEESLNAFKFVSSGP
jgi:hypothetical protein